MWHRDDGGHGSRSPWIRQCCLQNEFTVYYLQHYRLPAVKSRRNFGASWMVEQFQRRSANSSWQRSTVVRAACDTNSIRSTCLEQTIRCCRRNTPRLNDRQSSALFHTWLPVTLAQHSNHPHPHRDHEMPYLWLTAQRCYVHFLTKLTFKYWVIARTFSQLLTKCEILTRYRNEEKRLHWSS